MDCGARPNPGCVHTFSFLRIVYSAYSDGPSRWRRNLAPSVCLTHVLPDRTWVRLVSPNEAAAVRTPSPSS